MTATNRGAAGCRVDGKLVRKFLFMRERRIALRADHFQQQRQAVEVEAFTKDHAVDRLCDAYGADTRKAWEFVDELEPEQTVGVLGEKLPLFVGPTARRT